VTDKMRDHLWEHVDKNGKVMYSEASDLVTKSLAKMATSLSSRLTYATGPARKMLKKDMQKMINLANCGEGGPPLQATRLQFKKALLNELKVFKDAWIDAAKDAHIQAKAADLFETEVSESENIQDSDGDDDAGGNQDSGSDEESD